MRRFFAFITTIIIIPLLSILIIAWSLFSLIDNPDNIKTTLARQNAYDKIASQVLPYYFDQVYTSPIALSTEEKVRITKAAFPYDTLQGTAEGMLDNIYSWLKYGSKFQYEISMVKPKTNAQEEMNAILKERYAKLPECEPSGLLSLRGQKLSEFPECRVPAENALESRYASFDSSELSSTSLNAVQDTIPLSISKSLANMPGFYAFLSLATKLLIIAVAILFILVISLLWKNSKTALRWPAVTLILVSLTLTAASYFGLSLLQEDIQTSIRHAFQNSPDSLASITTDAVRSLIVQSRSTLTTVSVVLFTCGAAGIIGSAFLPGTTTKSDQNPSELDQLT